MNISKLLKITALSCIGIFSINNNIVNATDNNMDIDDENNNGNIEIEINNNDDINDLIFGVERINVNDTDETKKVRNLIFNRAPCDIINYDGRYDNEELVNKIQNFKNIVLSNGDIAYYFVSWYGIKVFESTKNIASKLDKSAFNRLLALTNTIEDLCKRLGQDYKIYKVFSSDNGIITVKEYN